MYGFSRRNGNAFKVLVLGIVMVHALITWAIPLLHSEDCPATHDSHTGGASCPSDTACPACRFLAGCHALDVQCDPAPLLTQSQGIPALVEQSQIALSLTGSTSILLRGPPVVSPSLCS